MSRIIRNASEHVLGWASIKLGVRFRECASAWGITDRRGTLIGAAIFTGYQAKNIELTCVGPGAFKKDVCREIASYAFDDLQCERITLTVAANNEKVLGIAIKFGWRVEGRLRRYYGAVDAVVMGMLRRECPFTDDNETRPSGPLPTRH